MGEKPNDFGLYRVFADYAGLHGERHELEVLRQENVITEELGLGKRFLWPF